MLDQIIIGDKASFDDFGASVAKRAAKQPKKKTIKETVPFSNVAYDFTAINGEIYWEERELEYVFEIIAPTPERLEELKTDFANWVMNVIQQELHDPVIPDYHFLATYDDMSWDDDEGLDKTTTTVSFLAYPYKISNIKKVYEFNVQGFNSVSTTILNNSSHRITPTVAVDSSITLQINGVSCVVYPNTAIDKSIKLKIGANTVSLIKQDRYECNATISFYEEVF